MRFRNQAAADAFNKPKPRPKSVPGIGVKAGIKDRKSYHDAVSTMPDQAQKRLGRDAGKADMIDSARRNQRMAAPGWQKPGFSSMGATTQGPNDMGNGFGKGPSGPPPSGGIFAGGGGPAPPQLDNPMYSGVRDLGAQDSPPGGPNPWGPGAEGGMNAGGQGSLPPQPMGLADAVGMGGGRGRQDVNPDFGQVPGAKQFLGPHPNNPQWRPGGGGGGGPMGGPGGGGGGGSQPFQGDGAFPPPPQGAARAQMGQALRRRVAPQTPPMTNPGGPVSGPAY